MAHELDAKAPRCLEDRSVRSGERDGSRRGVDRGTVERVDLADRVPPAAVEVDPAGETAVPKVEGLRPGTRPGGGCTDGTSVDVATLDDRHRPRVEPKPGWLASVDELRHDHHRYPDPQGPRARLGTTLDRADLEFGVRHGVDFIGLSFVTDATDLRLARQIASWQGGTTPGLIAKIERPEALANVREIAAVTDGLMVARGDLGVQMAAERVPRAQKEIIRVANQRAVPVITATQMLESMVEHPKATRAEVSDIANAVLDGTDAVMLSEETAVGKYPLQAVQTMRHVIEDAERHLRRRRRAGFLL